MKNKVINNKGRAKIFVNPYLEMLTRTRPWIIYALYIPLIIFLVYYAWLRLQLPIKLIAVSFLLGMFFWTFFEYIVHRFLFHFKAVGTLGK